LNKAFQQRKLQQIQVHHNFNKHLMLHEKDINELMEDFDDLGHATSRLFPSSGGPGVLRSDV
jgi:hypothetical protein